MYLSDNTILITDGHAGIGRGLAEAFWRMGNKVLITGPHQETLDEIADVHPGMETMRLDQNNAEDIAQMAARVHLEYPDLNVLINSAGIQRIENAALGYLADAEAQVSVNLLGPIRWTAALLPHLLSKPKATIVNVTSSLAFVPGAMAPTYSATKAALHAYTLALRFQLQDTGVEVLELIPPEWRTGLHEAYKADPQAMPLDAYIAETMDILFDGPETGEVVVERARAIRFADRLGRFEEMFSRINRGRRETLGDPTRASRVLAPF